MRTKHMIISIILGLALLAESVIAAGLYVSRSKVQETAGYYKQECDRLREVCSAAILQQARLESELSEKSERVAELEASDTEKTMLIAAIERELAEYENMTVTTEPTGAGAYDDSGSVPWTIDRLPEGKTNTYRCMDFRKITLKNSDQLILQEDDCTSTEAGTGLRYSIIGGRKYYHAALASAYGLAIGNCFEFTLDTGYVIPVIHAEYKHAIEDAYKDDFGDPDENYAHEPTTSVIEFVYDWQTALQEVIGRGGMFVEPFADLSGKVGNIVKVKYLGRLWKP